MRLKTYIVEDNPTIRENLIGTLEELACVSAVGSAETENDGKSWLNEHRHQWDLAIIDLFLKLLYLSWRVLNYSNPAKAKKSQALPALSVAGRQCPVYIDISARIFQSINLFLSA